MRRSSLLFILLLIQQVTFSQKKEVLEFEGYIEYKHIISSPYKDVDIAAATKIFRTSSIYYYKKGFHKWEYANGDCEIYDPVQNKVFTYTHLEGTSVSTTDQACVIVKDSLFTRTEMVADVLCKQYYIETISPRGSEMKRVFSYSEKYPLLPAHYKEYKNNRLDHIYAKIRAVPLMIELMVSGPLLVVYKATKIVSQKIDDKVFQHP
jgi:hypothetical protein